MKTSITLKLGALCNNRCIYCRVSNLSKDLTAQEIKKRILLIAKTNNHDRIIFSGGEPTARKDLLEIIHFTKKNHMDYGLATNLRMFSNKSFYDKIKKIPPSAIYASFPSHDKKILEKINSRESYNEVILGLENALKLESDIVVNIVLNKLNLDSISETINFLQKKGVSKISLSKIWIFSEEYRNLELTDNQLLALLKKIKKEFKSRKITFYFNNFEESFYNNIFENSITDNQYLNITHKFEAVHDHIRSISESGNQEFQEKSSIIRIIDKCNQNCIYCDVFENQNEIFITDAKEIVKHVRHLARKENVSKIIISGGEPTLSKNLKALISIIKKEGLKVQLQTNALLFAYNNFNGVNIDNVDSFFISLPSHNEKMDALTRTPGSFRLAVKGIKNILKKNKKIKINHVVMEDNYRDLPFFADFIIDNFKEVEIIIDFVRLNGRAKNKSRLLPRISDYTPYLIEAMQRFKSAGVNFVLSYGAPPVCFYPEFRFNHAEFLKISSFQIDDAITQYTALKSKPKSCNMCKYNTLCLGVLKRYVQLHGNNEIKKVQGQT